jgi:transposase InsO family protein
MIEKLRQQFSITALCRAFKVGRSGYYAWRKRPLSARACSDARLIQLMLAIEDACYFSYGAYRMTLELGAKGIQMSRKKATRLMKLARIKLNTAKSFKPCTTISDPSHLFAPNLLKRQFNDFTAPDQAWGSDISFIPTREGFLYVAGIQDFFSRRIVGLTMAEHMRTELVTTAFEMACQNRQPDAGLLHHSDRGSQYTSHTYRALLEDHGAIVSMSRKGDCFDNAPVESFWATLKRECANRVFDTRAEARAVIFQYVMGFYNYKRRHSALGYLSPHDFEIRSKRQILCA